jgi:hypothetical protein
MLHLEGLACSKLRSVAACELTIGPWGSEFMTIAPQPDQVRLLVARIFGEFGIHVRNVVDLNETLLVQSGRYVARSYRANGLMAMWLLRAGIVQFYDAKGTMLRTVNLLKRLRPHPMAA